MLLPVHELKVDSFTFAALSWGSLGKILKALSASDARLAPEPRAVPLTCWHEQCYDFRWSIARIIRV
ncbi:MAG: hypothetical protein CMJ62_16225 [Planctomycetaceae bacterium]|nr:hypothetical protein [Planctomycetaceae bacterium]